MEDIRSQPDLFAPPSLTTPAVDASTNRRRLSRVVFSHQSVHWHTPKDVYEKLNSEFDFDFDPCPLHSSFDGLAMSWRGKRVFCNPPYDNIKSFLTKARESDLSVFLIPARTDTRWFHEIVLPHAVEIRFIKGRLKFGGAKNSAPFPSMVVIFVLS